MSRAVLGTMELAAPSHRLNPKGYTFGPVGAEPPSEGCEPRRQRGRCHILPARSRELTSATRTDATPPVRGHVAWGPRVTHGGRSPQPPARRASSGEVCGAKADNGTLRALPSTRALSQPRLPGAGDGGPPAEEAVAAPHTTQKRGGNRRAPTAAPARDRPTTTGSPWRRQRATRPKTAPNPTPEDLCPKTFEPKASCQSISHYLFFSTLGERMRRTQDRCLCSTHHHHPHDHEHNHYECPSAVAPSPTRTTTTTATMAATARTSIATHTGRGWDWRPVFSGPP